MPIGRSDYSERKERKIDALEVKAAKARELSDEQLNRAHKLGSAIPFGQPILVDHHSEGAHRSHVKKMETAHRKSIEADEKASYYQDRADTASDNRAISGDNPDALKLYQDKLAKLEADQERMKEINKAFRQGDAALKELGMTDSGITKMKAGMPSYEKKPCPTWMLSNNSAEIRRVKEKIEALNRLDGLEAELIKFSGGELRISVDINRVQFIFDAIPAPEVRSLLKSHGFKWARSEGAWQRQRTLNAVYVAKCMISAIEGEKK